MTTRLIYLLEEDFRYHLADVLNEEDFSNQKVVFFVELRKMDDQVIPMISDLVKIRLKKAEDRLIKWIEKNVTDLENFEVHAFDGKPSKSNPGYKLNFANNEDFHVLVTPDNEYRLAPYLKHNAGVHQVRYLSLGDFKDQDING